MLDIARGVVVTAPFLLLGCLVYWLWTCRKPR